MSEEQVTAPKEVESELDRVLKELADYKDKYFRALAEAENTRKRLQREKMESQSFAVQNVILDILHPLDHFEQALRHVSGASDEVKHWAAGFSMILDQLKQVISDNGVVGYESKGVLFDPHLHEAIETEVNLDVPDGTILEEFVKGYKIANRVIRPARVRVAVRALNGSDTKEQEEK